jgi:hypothetical protein
MLHDHQRSFGAYLHTPYSEDRPSQTLLNAVTEDKENEVRPAPDIKNFT